MTQPWIILLFGLGLMAAKLTGETDTDVDEGHDWDITDINEAAGLDLFEGDIEEGVLRNTRIGDKYRWPKSVPYYLEDSLEINAKGVILKAFEQYRLKTCIDFTPRKGKGNYISVYKGPGCFSSVGNQRWGSQRLSIGEHCDSVATVEHEFLHALGFWHEQSRSDRDDYVDIIWSNIKPNKGNNFAKHDDTESSALGVPYDYMSVMHYGKMYFTTGSGPTIVTKDPHFSDVIGQRIGFSASDLTKLNRLYNCTTSVTFVDSCDFEDETICGMIQGPGNKKWKRCNSVRGEPQTDFTNMRKYKGPLRKIFHRGLKSDAEIERFHGSGYFMHFSTASANPGDRASLQSRMLYPKPGAQCLQFFLFNTGAADDVLNVWVKEYDETNPSGKLQLYKSISGGDTGVWNLHHVNIYVAKEAHVIFEGVRGKQPSSGGFSLDDINLSSTKCPHHIWPVRKITKSQLGEAMFSPRFLSPTGYSFQIQLKPNAETIPPGYMVVYFHLTSGPNDRNLKWPCPWHQVTMVLMDQQSDIREQMNMHLMLTTDPKKMSSDGTEFFWDNPRKVGSKETAPDGSSFYRGPGQALFIERARLKGRNFIKGDDAFFLFSVEDISHLLLPQPLPQFGVHADAKAAD
ncbi:meprin A subunit beta-like isoform X1 [Sphaeramia orbicularis]|uniref:meprin A subunit beta-like isoform X1 n=1 Tax=Sphaeramia orbicularis TaxID=375764 RepID=UPI00117CE206|nr:meprin A subunit beta-like isoform X1 [Sphaeramia orbicularis]